ncbi:MAG: hypothetical protein ACPGGK_16160 [Pikeienuella sp.]
MKLSKIAVSVAMLLLAACAAPQINRADVSGPSVRISSVETSGVVIYARRNIVRAPAPEGHCVYPGSVGLIDGAAHLLMGACEFYQPRSQVTPVALSVNAGNGLYSISIQGEALGFQGQGYDAALAALEKMLAAEDQRTAAAADTARVASVSRDSEAVYVMVDSVNGRFCRAFTELNGRLASISYLGAPSSASEAEIISSLIAYVRFLRQANGHSAVISG